MLPPVATGSAPRTVTSVTRRASSENLRSWQADTQLCCGGDGGGGRSIATAGAGATEEPCDSVLVDATVVCGAGSTSGSGPSITASTQVVGPGRVGVGQYQMLDDSGSVNNVSTRVNQTSSVCDWLPPPTLPMVLHPATNNAANGATRFTGAPRRRRAG